METQGAVDVVRIDGTLNADKAKELTIEVGRLVRAGAPMVMCDLTSVQLVDSDGLEALLDAQEELSNCGGAMKLAGASPLVSDILRLTGVETRFELFETASAGVGSFAQ